MANADGSASFWVPGGLTLYFCVCLDIFTVKSLKFFKKNLTANQDVKMSRHSFAFVDNETLTTVTEPENRQEVASARVISIIPGCLGSHLSL